MAINYEKLIRGHTQLFESKGENTAKKTLKEAFASKSLNHRDFDFGKLFSECFGHDRFAECRNGELATNIMEAAGAVTTAAFQNISGQIVYSAILEGFTREDLVVSKLIPEVQTPFSGEKIPGISNLGTGTFAVNEQEPYPLVGVREDWIQTPETIKYGRIVPLTREAIFFDRTGQLLERAGEVGYWMGVDKELRAIDCLIDENVTAHRYNWRGTSYASYQASTPWINISASAALVDWTDIDAAQQIANAITDPNTSLPFRWMAKHLVVTKQNEQVANRIVNATEIRVATPGYATTGNPTQTNMANPYLNAYDVVTSVYLAYRMATDTSWFLGDVTKYAKYMYNWPLQVKEAPPNSHDEFHRDIVQQFRGDERGAYVVVEPRQIVKSTA